MRRPPAGDTRRRSLRRRFARRRGLMCVRRLDRRRLRHADVDLTARWEPVVVDEEFEPQSDHARLRMFGPFPRRLGGVRGDQELERSPVRQGDLPGSRRRRLLAEDHEPLNLGLRGVRRRRDGARGGGGVSRNRPDRHLASEERHGERGRDSLGARGRARLRRHAAGCRPDPHDRAVVGIRIPRNLGRRAGWADHCGPGNGRLARNGDANGGGCRSGRRLARRSGKSGGQHGSSTRDEDAGQAPDRSRHDD